MSLPKMQPTFTVNVPIDKEEALRRMKSAVTAPELSDHAETAGNVFDFKIEQVERRFWSPHLSVHLSEVDSGTEIFARYSPRPEIWTMFMAIYFIVAMGMGFAAIVGGTQMMLEFSPWAFLFLPVGALVIGGLHIASLIGQGLSSDQMQVLRNRFDRAVEIAFPEHC